MTQPTLLFNPPDRDVISLLRSLKPSLIAILTDTNTHKHSLPTFERVSRRFPNVNHITIKAGEKNKNFQTVQQITNALLEANADRNTILVNLGGGVVTDVGGFAASIYKRGIRYVNVPTTLLAQADAAIGGKTGINTGSIKNAVGTFYPPVAIVINTTYLDTLSDKEGLNGLAEVMKHALLEGDEHWKTFRSFLDDKIKLIELLKMSVAFKNKVVEQDPFEKEYRQILNFGHTIGHAIEAYSLENDRPVKHGYAVAQGMRVALTLSEQHFKLQKPGFKEAKELIVSLYPRLDMTVDDMSAMLSITENDKKVKNGKICFVLLDGIGKPQVDCLVPQKNIETAVKEILAT